MENIGSQFIAALSIFGINIAFWKKIDSDSVIHPVRYTLILYGFEFAVAMIIIFYYHNFGLGIFVLALTTVSIIWIYKSIKNRDKKGIYYGELLIPVLMGIDISINGIAHQIITNKTLKDNITIEKQIQNCIDFILNQIHRFSSGRFSDDGLIIIEENKENEKTNVCLYLIKSNGRFSIKSSVNINTLKIIEAEAKFRHGKKPIGLVGHVTNKKKPVFIPDLSHRKDESLYWELLETECKYCGSTALFPIKSDIGKEKNPNIAILCFYNSEPKSLDIRVITQIVSVFSPKLELLLYLLQIEILLEKLSIIDDYKKKNLNI